MSYVEVNTITLKHLCQAALEKIEAHRQLLECVYGPKRGWLHSFRYPEFYAGLDRLNRIERRVMKLQNFSELPLAERSVLLSCDDYNLLRDPTG